ncbi:hypothetical protein LS68_009230 [Helicobacter sp. MIT 05-5293]|uniref:hypothetical protein n=1 Tax=unclassified Helicobacter TaxID=2593540 RepID=UPI00051D125A|nr:MULTISPECIES: hypothetical protein [unclassified Helicobacter]TLD79843.1 hypothetical protein LS68_009230 [Helicobacter sp. MIT 05-5293]TLD85429.1 hypothetical protein LS69_009630 [Helicobacter sp. MIT 05-5294]
MSYTIPLKNKPILHAQSDSVEFFNFSYTHTSNESTTISITNPNVYAIEVLFALNAGSGDTNDAYTLSPQRWESNITYTQYMYNQAGRAGVDVRLKYQDRLLLALSGGSGTPAGDILQSRSIRRWTTKGGGLNSNKTYQKESIGGWSAKNNVDNRREGENGMYILTLKPNTSAEVEFVYNNASSAPFKGSVHITGIV